VDETPVLRISPRRPTAFNPHRFEGGSMGIMGFIKLVIVGLIVGAIARWIMPGAQAMGWIMTSLIGIAGSVVGGLISSVMWRSPAGQFHPAGWIMSIAGALIVLWGYLAFMK
jgi:uncharacterized membrane protein YeaQ/YmgE (transglycosylase-associated protein family)